MAAMKRYLALLRGVNVGGKGMIRMAELRDALAAAGLSDVRTYIQSGNVIFSSGVTDTGRLTALIKKAIRQSFNLDVDAAVFPQAEWGKIISAAPDWWGVEKTWKHNLLVMIEPYRMQDVLEAIGNLKPDIESVQPGKGVLYQSLSLAKFGRTSSSKLVGTPVYKRMTIRNFNTAMKLKSLLEEPR